MPNSHMRRNRRLRQDQDAQDAAVASIEKAGFHVQRFSQHHYRVDYYVDFWPITGRWRQMNGAFEGHGIEPLLAKLLEHRGI